MDDATFWANVDQSGGPDACWPWTRATRKGYGAVKRDGWMQRTHRVAWELANGPIPDGLHVMHSCDNPPCCNPAHLSTGTHADNMAQKAERGRSGRDRKRPDQRDRPWRAFVNSL